MAQDSSGIQYSDTPPTVTGKTSQRKSGGSSDADRGSAKSGQSSTPSGSTDKDGSKDDSSQAAAGKGGPGGGDGSGSATGEKQAGGAGGEANALDTAPTSSDDGGSSPLVPILIALAVLAAISIGVVATRKKRQDADPGAPASPEAG